MQLRVLGRTGLLVSPIGFGGSSLGSVFRTVTTAEGHAAVHAALDAGINYFDTAPFYGATVAEAALGTALARVPRERYLMATKVGRYGGPTPHFDFSADRVTRSVDESLRRLRCGHLDLIQVHDMEFGSLEQICTETIPALERLREQGKVRFVGITALPLKTLEIVAARTNPDTVLSYCHYCLNDTSFAPLAARMQQEDRGVINAAPFAMGLLTPHPLPSWHPAPPILREACAAAVELCRVRGASLPRLALQFALSNPDIDTTVVGLASAGEVREIVEWSQSPPDPALLADVQALLKPVRNLTWRSGRAENNA